jgi:hypothetical protein
VLDRLSQLTRAIAALTLLSGCGSDPTSENPPDISGSYSMTSLLITSIDHPEIKAERIQPGVSIDFLLRADDSLTIVIHQTGLPNLTSHGTVTVSGDSVTMTEGPATFRGTWSKSGATLIIRLTSGVNVDIEGDGVAEAVTMRMTLREV